jgi:hypothetical protein
MEVYEQRKNRAHIRPSVAGVEVCGSVAVGETDEKKYGSIVALAVWSRVSRHCVNP